MKPQNAEFVKESLKSRQAKQKSKFDKHVPKSDLKPLIPEEKVIIKHNDQWIHGSVAEKHELSRSYVVKGNNGRKYSRTRRDLSQRTLILRKGGKKKTWKLHHFRIMPPNMDRVDRKPERKPTIGNAEEMQKDAPQKIPSPLKTRSGREIKLPSRFVISCEISDNVFNILFLYLKLSVKVVVAQTEHRCNLCIDS